MAATTTTSVSTSQNTWPSFQDIKDNLCDLQRWKYLIPIVGAIGIGSFFVPNVGIGVAAVAALHALDFAKIFAFGIKEKEIEHPDFITQYSLIANLLGPTLEELVFRGAMQPLLTQAIVWIVPAAAAAFLGTPLSIATTVSIMATAVIFGLAHLIQRHDLRHTQAASTTIMGIAYGFLAAQFGLGAAIGAHIAHNTIVMTTRVLFLSKNPQPTTTTTSTTL